MDGPKRIDALAAHRLFMLAFLRANDTRHAHLLSLSQLTEAFNIAQIPGITIEEWCRLQGIEMVYPETKPMESEQAEMSEESQAAQNKSFFEQLKSAAERSPDVIEFKPEAHKKIFDLP